jgi:hypothetical protein
MERIRSFFSRGARSLLWRALVLFVPPIFFCNIDQIPKYISTTMNRLPLAICAVGEAVVQIASPPTIVTTNSATHTCTSVSLRTVHTPLTDCDMASAYTTNYWPATSRPNNSTFRQENHTGQITDERASHRDLSLAERDDHHSLILPRSCASHPGDFGGRSKRERQGQCQSHNLIQSRPRESPPFRRIFVTRSGHETRRTMDPSVSKKPVFSQRPSVSAVRRIGKTLCSQLPAQHGTTLKNAMGARQLMHCLLDECTMAKKCTLTGLICKIENSRDLKRVFHWSLPLP